MSHCRRELAGFRAAHHFVTAGAGCAGDHCRHICKDAGGIQGCAQIRLRECEEIFWVDTHAEGACSSKEMFTSCQMTFYT